VKLLILGGTGDAKTLARELHNKGVDVVYSIAGLVRQPDLPCEVISGGFSIRGGLSQYILNNNITALLDATHPFATKMSKTAAEVSEQLNLTLWQYLRPDWVSMPEDNWTFFNDWSDLVSALASYKSIFLTQGQLTEPMLAALNSHRKREQQFIHRTAVKPERPIPDWMECIQGIGPFSSNDELALLKAHKIEVVVSKHSGGEIPSKILAARSLSLPVLLLAQSKNITSQYNRNAYTDIPTLLDTILTCSDSIWSSSMNNFENTTVATVFENYPVEIKQQMMALRQLIMDTATETEGVSALEETLKWGEPSYLTKGGSTIRIDWKQANPNEYAMYFNCKSKLVDTFKELYQEELTFDGNRAIVLKTGLAIPSAELKHCVSLALTYHKIKHLPLLGA